MCRDRKVLPIFLEKRILIPDHSRHWSFFFSFKGLFSLTELCACVSVHVRAGTSLVQKRALDTPGAGVTSGCEKLVNAVFLS